jgi:hypothetical protein
MEEISHIAAQDRNPSTARRWTKTEPDGSRRSAKAALQLLHRTVVRKFLARPVDPHKCRAAIFMIEDASLQKKGSVIPIAPPSTGFGALASSLPSMMTLPKSTCQWTNRFQEVLQSLFDPAAHLSFPKCAELHVAGMSSKRLV